VKTFSRPTNAKGLEFDFQNVVGRKDRIEPGDIQILEVRRLNKGNTIAAAILLPSAATVTVFVIYLICCFELY